MATQVKMPQLGETVVEGTITRWLKREGDSVGVDEPLVEVSTDKVDSEIPSPAAGTVVRIHAGEGETVTVGSVIAEIAGAGEAALPPPTATAPKPPAAAAPAAPAGAAVPAGPPAAPGALPPVPAPAPVTPASTPGPTPIPAVPAPVGPAAAPVPAAVANNGAGGVAALESSSGEPLRGVLSPIVRKLAHERGVDLASLRGSGTGGRITKQDVLAAAPAPAENQASPVASAPVQVASATAGAAPAVPAVPSAAQPATAQPATAQPATAQGATAQGATAQPATAQGATAQGATAQPATAEPAGGATAEAGRAAPSYHAASTGSDEVVQVSHMRKAIAEHMVASSLETARAWNTIEVDMTRIFQLRSQIGAAFKEREGFSLTWMPFVCKAVTQALLRYPEVNATWNGDGSITRKHYVNLGIAVALENGLIVPVMKHADGMNLVGLARSVRDLAQRARARHLLPDDVQGGTFTITNPGPFGSIMSVPIINRGQAGILAFDAVTKRPAVMTGADGTDTIGIRHMVFLSISWDHRVIDGAEAAKFLAELKALLEGEDFSADLSAYLPGAR